MANYQTHLATSSALGLGVGAAAAVVGEFPLTQAAMAGVLTGIGGILPDLDSESGRPVREVFSLTAAVAPLVAMQWLHEFGGDADGALFLAVLGYISIRYGGPLILGLVSVHRGMFHSIPAMAIAGELTYLGYLSRSPQVKLLMAFGVAAGFLSHLVLDEIYAVEWHGLKVRLNKFAGSAVKFWGKSWGANAVTYGLLFSLTYLAIAPPPTPASHTPLATPRPVKKRPLWELERVEKQDLRRR